MKPRIIKLLLLLAALLLQYSAVQNLRIFSFCANLCILALVGISYFSSPSEAAVYGGVLGLLMDGAVGRRFGVQLLLCMYLALAVKLFANEKINNSPALMSLHAWLFTIVYYLSYGLLSAAVPAGSIGAGRWLITAGATATVNMVISLPIFWLVERLVRRFAHE